jgi:hypothetical protein
MQTLKRPLLILSFALVVSSLVHAQTLSLSGFLYRYSPGTPSPSPVIQYEIYLFGQSGMWIGPAITDINGGYAFYNLPPGKYLMRIYRVQYQSQTQSQRVPVWEQQVQVPGVVNPIVLPQDR